MSYGSNPYYQPEAFGLTKVIEEDASGGYDFDIFIIWKHADGRVFYGHDSGCSCPSPFENVSSLEDLDELADWEDFEQEVTIWTDYLKRPDSKHNLLVAGAGALP